MADKRNIVKNQNSGVFQDLILRVKLILRLVGDRRVNFFLKLLPIASLIYVVSPIDLFPGAVLPVVGALDDAAALWLGMTLFVSLCPDEVVQEHMNALEKVVPASWRDVEEAQTTEIIEAESRPAPEDGEAK